MRPSTASTTSGSASIVAATPSSCRPPWFETTTPAAPCSHARRASSAVSTPLRTTGRPASEAKRSTSAHVTDADIWSNASAGVIPPRPSEAIATSGGIVKPLRSSRSRRREHGRVDGEHERREPRLARAGDDVGASSPGRGTRTAGTSAARRSRRSRRTSTSPSSRGRASCRRRAPRAPSRPRRRGERPAGTRRARSRAASRARGRAPSSPSYSPRRRRARADEAASRWNAATLSRSVSSSPEPPA